MCVLVDYLMCLSWGRIIFIIIMNSCCAIIYIIILNHLFPYNPMIFETCFIKLQQLY